ncbi:hypothetical protein ACI2KR_27335 [Pseudomonas luteola]
MLHTKTLKVRVRDKHAPLLRQMARSVNFVWNYLNELSQRSIRERGGFLSAYDFHPYTKGAAKELGLHSQTLQCIAAEYVTRRKQFKKVRLNWRKSAGVHLWESPSFRAGRMSKEVPRKIRLILLVDIVIFWSLH